MSNHNTTNLGDRTVVNLNEPYEVQYWARKWNIPPEELRDAVKITGSLSVSDIEKFITGKEYKGKQKSVK